MGEFCCSLVLIDTTLAQGGPKSSEIGQWAKNRGQFRREKIGNGDQ